MSDQIKKIQEGIENEANLRRMEEQEHEATEQFLFFHYKYNKKNFFYLKGKKNMKLKLKKN